MRIEIIDLKIGNIASICNMIRHIGLTPSIIERSNESDSPDWIILPGVGSYDYGVQRLKAQNFDELLIRHSQTTNILGICLGMQLLCEASEEGEKEGLGLIDGRFKRFPHQIGPDLRVPHMGWNQVQFINETQPPFIELEDSPRFYFVHSYYYSDVNSSVVWATSSYGVPFVSAIKRQNIFGVQFHPEKSHRYGISFFKQLLKR